MSNYKVTMDGVQYTDIGLPGEDEWIEDIEVKLERGERITAFFIKYALRLSFRGKAYKHLRSLGLCDSVELEIQKRCSNMHPFEKLVKGYVLTKDTEFDTTKCIATSDLESSSIFDTFEKAKERKVYLNDNLKPLRNFKESDGTLLPQTNNVDYAWAIDVHSAFSYILNDTTNGQVQFKSDFFSTPRRDTSYVIFIDGIVNGEIFTMRVTDELGNVKILNIEYDTSFPNPSDTFNGRIVDVMQTFDGYGYYSAFSTGSITTITLQFNGKNTTLDLAYTNGAASVSYTGETYQEGGDNFYISSGNMLTNKKADAPFERSFDDLYGIYTNIYDLSFDFENVAGQWYVRVEPKSYFLTKKRKVIDFTNCNITTSSYLSDSAVVGVQVGLYGKYQFYNLKCGAYIDRALDKDLRFSRREIIDQITGVEDYGDDTFLIEGAGLGSFYDEPRIYTSGIDYTGVPMGGSIKDYNVLIKDDINLLKYHLEYLPDAIEIEIIDYRLSLLSTGTSEETNIIKSFIGDPKQFIETVKVEGILGDSSFSKLNTSTFLKIIFEGKERIALIDEAVYENKSGKLSGTLIIK